MDTPRSAAYPCGSSRQSPFGACFSTAPVRIEKGQDTEPMLPDDAPIQLRSAILERGACVVGFADVSRLGQPITSSYPWGICFALRYDDHAVEALPEDAKWLEMSHRLGNQAKEVYAAAERMLDSWGYRYTHITSDIPSDVLPDLREDIPQKTIATLAGLGWIGKSTLLVTPMHGPRIRIGTILTNMHVPTAEATANSRCGECTACVDACPTGAIKGGTWNPLVPRSHMIDVFRCHAYLWSTRRSLGRRQSCGLCVKVCPIGIT